MELDAYDSSGNEIAVAGPVTSNINTGLVDELAVSSSSADIASVVVHDDGNYFLVDSLCTDAANVAGSVTPAILVGGGAPGVHSTSCSSGDPVNCVTGEYWTSVTDARATGPGFPLRLSRTYSTTQANISGPLGYGWNDSYNQDLTLDSSGDVTVHNGNGSSFTAANTSSGLVFPSYVPDTLVHNSDGTYTLTLQTGDQEVFSSAGLLVQEVSRLGYVTQLSYNSSSQLTTVTDAFGRTLAFTYNSSGQVSSVTDPAGRSTSYSYDSSGNLSGVTETGGGTWSYAYDSNHLLVSETDPMGRVTALTYDTSNRAVSLTDPMGRVTTYSYSQPAGDDGTTLVTSPGGSETLYQYAGNELTSVTRGYGSSNPSTWTYTYDPVTLGVATATDPDGNQTTHTYNSLGELTQTVDPMGRTTNYTYNAFGEVSSMTDPSGVTTSNSYNSAGNLLSTSTPLMGTTKFRVTSYVYGNSKLPGLATESTSPTGGVTKFAYNKYGNLTSVTDPLGHVARASFNSLGWRLSTTTPSGHKTTYGTTSWGTG